MYANISDIQRGEILEQIIWAGDVGRQHDNDLYVQIIKCILRAFQMLNFSNSRGHLD